MKKCIFKGVATALATPQNKNGIDYNELDRLIEWQLDQGIKALVIAGTTGEASTLTLKEHEDLLLHAIEKVKGRAAMIAGTGSNDTNCAIDMSRCASKMGYDAMLVVTPYYNKTTQTGLVKMYEAISNAIDKPIILYNVPSRTGINIEPKTYLELSNYTNVYAIKEANGDIGKIAETMSLIRDKLYVYSGNDDEIVPILSMGGIGVISVLSNIMPKETIEICDKFFAGDIEGSRKIQLDLMPLIKALFSEVNPIPVRAALSKMGFGENYLRLPLVPMSKEKENILFDIMRKNSLIK